MPLAVRWAAGAGAAVAVLIALAGLGRWWSGAWRGATAPFGHQPMAPGTALVFLLLGAAVIVQSIWAPRRTGGRIGLAAAGAAFAVSCLVGAGDLLGADLRWERWLAGPGAAAVGRMSVLTALVFSAAAASLASQLPPLVWRRLFRYGGIFLAGLGLLFAVVTALAYATATPLFYGTGVVPMARSTAAAFIGLNFALLLTGAAESWRRSSDREAEGVDPTGYARRVGGRVGAIALVAASVTLAGFLYLRHQQLALRAAIWTQLGAIADLKAAQVGSWQAERRDDARFLMRAPAVARDLAAFLARPEAADRRTDALAWLQLLKGGNRYESLVFFDAQLRPQLATSAAGVTVDSQLRRLLEAARGGADVVSSDLFALPDGGIRFDLAVPVQAPGPGARPVLGCVLLRLDPHQNLYPLLQAWPVPSATAETVLVRREGDAIVYLNELRNLPNAALVLRRSLADQELPASQALRGHLGPIEGVDYRGIPVLAAVRAIPGTPWIMEAKVDQAEIYAPLGREASMVGVLIGLILLAMGLGFLFLRRHRHAERLERRSAQLEGLVDERTAAAAAESGGRRRAEAQLRFRSEAEHLLQEISAALLAAATDETDATITQALERLAIFTGADAAYIFTFDADRTHFSQTHLWTRPVLTTRRENLQGLEVAAMPWWMSQIFRGQEVVVPSVARLPAEAAVEQKIIQSQQVAAVVDVPMMLHGTAVGFIGMNSAREGHIWRLEDTDLLRTVAQVMTSALQRRSVEQELRRHRERLEELVAQRTAALHESERRFQVLFEQAQVAIGVSRGGEVLFVNPACARLFGYEQPAEMAGCPLDALIAPAARAAMAERRRERSAPGAGREEFETVGRRRDGTEFDEHAAVNRIDLADGPATLAFLTDVTSRKQVERALGESEARFHSLFDHSADGILLTIPDGRILAANRAACRLLGRTEAEIIAAGRAGIIDLHDPQVAALLAERTRAGNAQGEMTLIRGDGTQFPAEVSSAVFATGEGLRTSMVIRDITERKRVFPQPLAGGGGAGLVQVRGGDGHLVRHAGARPPLRHRRAVPARRRGLAQPDRARAPGDDAAAP